MITLIACLSQNLIPIHIAYIPILIPPMLVLMNNKHSIPLFMGCIHNLD